MAIRCAPGQLVRAVVPLVVLAAGCAARAAKPAQPGLDLARAFELATAGCYTCLHEALTIYQQQLQAGRHAPAGVADRAFETALLIALREKELGIPADAAFEQARALEPQAVSQADALPPATLIELARLAPPDLRGAIDLMGQAQTAFPGSPAIALARAHALRAYGELDAALAAYDHVLAMVPTLREALLGRIITLSYLERHPEVIDTATRMIELGRWLLGDAHYWRARSRYVLKALDEAWSDAERATQLAANTNVYTLAGVIAYDRKELETAKDRFLQARKMDGSNCTAHSYYALVLAAQSHWPEATPVFSLAMSCFVKAAADARGHIAELEAADIDPVYKARLLAERQKTLQESELKGAQAGYNAAQGFLRAGNRGDARTHLQVALDHPELQAQADKLLKLIGQ